MKNSYRLVEIKKKEKRLKWEKDDDDDGYA